MGDYDDDWGNPYHDPPPDRNNPYARREKDYDLKKKLAEKARINDFAKRKIAASKAPSSTFPKNPVPPASVTTPPSVLPAVEELGTKVKTTEEVYVVAIAPNRPGAPRRVMDKTYEQLLDEGLELQDPKYYRVTRTVMETTEEITEDEWHLKREPPDPDKPPF